MDYYKMCTSLHCRFVLTENKQSCVSFAISLSVYRKRKSKERQNKLQPLQMQSWVCSAGCVSRSGWTRCSLLTCHSCMYKSTTSVNEDYVMRRKVKESRVWRAVGLHCHDVLSKHWLSFLPPSTHSRYYKPSVLLMCFFVPMFVPWYLWGESLWVAYFIPALLRYTLVLNATWLVNSAAHMWGNRPYDKSINPRENKFVTFSAIGTKQQTNEQTLKKRFGRETNNLNSRTDIAPTEPIRQAHDHLSLSELSH